MQTQPKKVFASLAIIAGILSTYPTATYASDMKQQLEQRLDILEQRVRLLEKDDIEYGPIKVNHIHLDTAKHYAVVQPGQTFDCSFHYQLDSSKQEFLSKNHLIVGLKGVAAETCATHLYGVWDSSGTANFKLVAPLKEGIYAVRIAYRPGDTCQEALNTWTILRDEPSNFATIGLIKVCRNCINP